MPSPSMSSAKYTPEIGVATRRPSPIQRPTVSSCAPTARSRSKVSGMPAYRSRTAAAAPQTAATVAPNLGRGR